MSEKIGIYVCECGPNIASKVDIEKIMDEISKLEDFKDKELVVKRHKLLCSNEGKGFLEKEINENKLTHLVCAACSPRDHDTTFINVCKKTQLNPYLYRIVNIREHCAWIIPDKDEGTRKAIQYIHAGMNRVLYQDSLFEKELDSNPDVLIIGGGIAGMEAALNLADEKRKVFLIEKEEILGGKAVFLPEQKISDVQKNKNIKVFTKTVLDKLIGFMGNFEIILKSTENPDETTELLAGAVVVATGHEFFDSKKLPEINFEDKDDVINSLEAERMFSENK